MRQFLILMTFAIAGIAAYATPRCQSFNNHDNKVTVVFTDDRPDGTYCVTDVRLIPNCTGLWKGKEYKASSVNIAVKKGIATGILTFDHLTRFSNPRIKLKINGKKASFKVCQ